MSSSFFKAPKRFHSSVFVSRLNDEDRMMMHTYKESRIENGFIKRLQRNIDKKMLYIRGKNKLNKGSGVLCRVSSDQYSFVSKGHIYS